MLHVAVSVEGEERKERATKNTARILLLVK
jgi:hypothetical protein